MLDAEKVKPVTAPGPPNVPDGGLTGIESGTVPRLMVLKAVPGPGLVTPTSDSWRVSPAPTSVPKDGMNTEWAL